MKEPHIQTNDGLITVSSQHSVADTADRFEQIVSDKGMKIFARIDHAQGAKSIDQELRSTELIIFGNPMSGTPLMQASQLAAIDLPMKALVWEDAEGKTWLTYNDPSYLVSRHNLEGCDEVISKITNALNNFAKAATT